MIILERQSVKIQLYNFNDLSADRAWLYNELLSDTDSDTEISDEDEYIREMLKTHVKQQRIRENFYKKTTVILIDRYLKIEISIKLYLFFDIVQKI